MQKAEMRGGIKYKNIKHVIDSYLVHIVSHIRFICCSNSVSIRIGFT